MKRKYTSLPFTEYTVAKGHYDTNRVYPIDKIVLHSSASTRTGLINTFAGGKRMVSSHYGIDNDGSLLAFLEEYNVAFAVGKYPVNQNTISIEHIDESSTIKLHTSEQYETSIKLVADICEFYNLPADDKHIVPHSSITATACPNGLDVQHIISGVQKLLKTTDPLQACLTAHKEAVESANKKEKQIKELKVELTACGANKVSAVKIISNLDKELNVLNNKSKQYLLERDRAVEVSKDYEKTISGQETEVLILTAQRVDLLEKAKQPIPYKRLYEEAVTEVQKLELLMTTNYVHKSKNEYAAKLQEFLIIFGAKN